MNARWIPHAGRDRGTAAALGGSTEAFLLRVIDGALLGLIVCVPFCMGGRQALGQLVLVSLASVAAAAWGARQCIRQESRWFCSPADLLLAAGVSLVAVQLIPWPPAVIDRLSPSIAGMLPVWGSSSHPSLGRWTQVSLTPADTRDALLVLLAYGFLFVVAVQRIDGIASVERMLKWIAITAGLMAAFGLVQYLLSNGKFFWFYEHPFTDTRRLIKGSFTNRNHFAQFLALGIGPLLWLIQKQWQVWATAQHERKAPRAARQQLVVWMSIVAVAITVFAGLMSLSRGGVAAIGIASAVTVAILYRAARLRGMWWSLVGLGALTLALLRVHGYEQVTARLDDFGSASMDQLDSSRGRRTVWSAVGRAIPNFPLLGAGVGSHSRVYPLHLDEATECEYTHAESSYLQLALETGAAGTVLVAAGAALCAFWCISLLRSKTASSSAKACTAAIAGGLAANLAHASIDFIWYVPGCMVVVVVLAACAFRLSQMTRSEKLPTTADPAVPRLVWQAATACVCLLGTWMIYSKVGGVLAEPHWHQYLRLNRVVQTAISSEHDRPSQLPQLSADETSLPQKIAELEAALRWREDDARCHVRLAEACLQQFAAAQGVLEGGMSVFEIREAAMHSRFASRTALDAWMARAIGAHRALLDKSLYHARRAVQICPLVPEAYLILAQVSFLEGGSPKGIELYVNQALKIAPCSGPVLFGAGKEAMLAGQMPRALECWKQSFHSGKKSRQRIVSLLADRVPPAFFFEYFDPDIDSLRLLETRYRKTLPPAEMCAFLKRYAQVAQREAAQLSGPAAARPWLQAHRLHSELGDREAALQSAERALACDSENLYVRRALGQSLLGQKRFDQAEEHLAWCIHRAPRDEALRRMHRAAARGRLSQRHRRVQQAMHAPPDAERGSRR